MSKHRVAFGAIIGVSAGLVAGLLLAPKAGRGIRTDLKVKAKELKEKAVHARQKAAKAEGKLTNGG